jgi:nucleotide-binding universal stress UspA family protein
MYSHILVALDGSEPSRFAGQAALTLAEAMGACVTACHVYGVRIHQVRFSDMEPGLPAQYQQASTLADLRTAHDRLIQEGFRALSAGYVEDFVASSADKGISVESVTLEGRSYVGILRLAEKCGADLIALGAHGLGAIGDGMLGGTTTRVLLNAPCDVLVARRAPGDGPLVVGIDGSRQAMQAAATAADIGQALNKPVRMTAVYDPDFHTRVFNVMGHSLSPQRQEEVGLAGQEELHDDIINDGLGQLYDGFLAEAYDRVSGNGTTVTRHLARGKAYAMLNSHAADANADLIVVSRYGHHREECSRLGSNAESLLRTASANVLLVGGIDSSRHHEETCDEVVERPLESAAVTWQPDAEARLKRVPIFARPMAKRAVEDAVRSSGKTAVSARDFDDVAARFGMGRPRGDQ